MGSNPFGVHRVGIHWAIAWPVNERPAIMLSARRVPLCGVTIEL